MTKRAYYHSLPVDELLYELDQYCRLQRETLLDKQSGVATSALKVAFNGAAARAGILIRDVAERLDVSINPKANPHAALADIARAAKVSGFYQTCEIEKLAALRQRVLEELATHENRPGNCIAMALAQVRIAKTPG